MTERKQNTSFIARMWLERTDNGDPIWRGHIQYVQGKQEAYFQSLDDMSSFIGKVSGVPGPATIGRAVPQGKEVAGKSKE